MTPTLREELIIETPTRKDFIFTANILIGAGCVFHRGISDETKNAEQYYEKWKDSDSVSRILIRTNLSLTGTRKNYSGDVHKTSLSQAIDLIKQVTLDIDKIVEIKLNDYTARVEKEGIFVPQLTGLNIFPFSLIDKIETAFKTLDNQKDFNVNEIAIKISNAEEKQTVIKLLMKLFDASNTFTVEKTDFSLICVDTTTKRIDAYFESACRLFNKIYNFNDISRFLKDYFNQTEETVEVRLNTQYTAVVHRDKVVVGCQTFTRATINGLIHAVKKIREK